MASALIALLHQSVCLFVVVLKHLSCLCLCWPDGLGAVGSRGLRHCSTQMITACRTGQDPILGMYVTCVCCSIVCGDHQRV